jgi:hypothetical protein
MFCKWSRRAQLCKSYAEFCIVPLKSRSRNGFSLTLTFMSEKIRFSFQPLV